jgi:acyl-CoA thioesterase FadM
MTVDFLKPVFLGQEIVAKGNVENILSDREVEIRGAILDGNGEFCAKASSIVSLLSFESVRKMGMFDDKLLNGIESMVERINSI